MICVTVTATFVKVETTNGPAARCGSLGPANAPVLSRQLLGFFSNGLTLSVPGQAQVLESLRTGLPCGP